MTTDPDADAPLDDRIVGELVRNGRISFADLGRAVGLSSHAAGERVRRLLRTGVIRGFTAVVDPRSRGEAYEALIDVRLLPQTPPEKFEDFVAALEEVREAWFVTGRYDYVLRMVCSDADTLDATVRTVRQRGGVAATETRIVMRTRSPYADWARTDWRP